CPESRDGALGRRELQLALDLTCDALERFVPGGHDPGHLDEREELVRVVLERPQQLPLRRREDRALDLPAVGPSLVDDLPADFVLAERLVDRVRREAAAREDARAVTVDLTAVFVPRVAEEETALRDEEAIPVAAVVGGDRARSNRRVRLDRALQAAVEKLCFDLPSPVCERLPRT